MASLTLFLQWRTSCPNSFMKTASFSTVLEQKDSCSCRKENDTQKRWNSWGIRSNSRKKGGLGTFWAFFQRTWNAISITVNLWKQLQQRSKQQRTFLLFSKRWRWGLYCNLQFTTNPEVKFSLGYWRLQKRFNKFGQTISGKRLLAKPMQYWKLQLPSNSALMWALSQSPSSSLLIEKMGDWFKVIVSFPTSIDVKVPINVILQKSCNKPWFE